MIRLRWIVFVGLIAISAVTAATLGAVFQKQKDDAARQHGPLGCCSCKEMRDLAMQSGESLDEFFEMNPSLDRNNCDGDGCATGYTRMPMPNLVQGSPYDICRTTGGDVTRTKSVVVIKSSTSTKTTAHSPSTTRATTTNFGKGFIASMTPSTKGWPTTTEVQDSKTGDSTTIASSPTSSVSFASRPASESQQPTSSDPAQSLSEHWSSISGANPDTSDNTSGSSEPLSATSSVDITSSCTTVDTDVLSSAPTTEMPTMTMISGGQPRRGNPGSNNKNIRNPNFGNPESDNSSINYSNHRNNRIGQGAHDLSGKRDSSAEHEATFKCSLRWPKFGLGHCSSIFDFCCWNTLRKIEQGRDSINNNSIEQGVHDIFSKQYSSADLEFPSRIFKFSLGWTDIESG
ncbi:hypothetical protein PG994_013716 [Apiospora phragmitis]|uniref:LysM domain-containing protein n=1 Tax=Apiospora phragmitis TaxID=2905665 RepID=A0ABR1TC11_9PEZI